MTPIIGVVGLGYVGLPVSLAFARNYQVIGIDIDEEKINMLSKFIDPTHQHSTTELKNKNIIFTSNEEKIAVCDYIIVTVPTPLKKTNEPNLTSLKQATKAIGKYMKPGTVIIFESTVYPGTTEEVCIPIIEQQSELKSRTDFHVGYSPERINPGDAERTFEKIPKVVAGQNEEALKKVTNLYEKILLHNVHQAPSIKVAEAAKVVENTQRDVNIALMNEFSIICSRLNIPTKDVLQAAETKWNFLPFTPGLVGGHCISVDPYYLIHKARETGYEPSLLTKARETNDDMPSFIVQSLLRLMMTRKMDPNKIRITILGITFKENIGDMRNSKALEILESLRKLQLNVQVCDPHANVKKLKQNYDVDLLPANQLKEADIIMLTVPHQLFDKRSFAKLLKKNGLLMDIKGVIKKEDLPKGIDIWYL